MLNGCLKKNPTTGHTQAKTLPAPGIISTLFLCLLDFLFARQLVISVTDEHMTDECTKH